MLLLAAVDNDERESMLTNIVLYCAVEAGESEATLLDQLVTDMSDWHQHHDGLCDRRLI